MEQVIRYPSVMIDIETLSSEPNAAVIQIGACAFDIRGGCAEPWRTLVRPDFDKTPPSLSTICWWMKQNDAARTHMALCETDGSHPVNALGRLAMYIGDYCLPKFEAWAMPPEFDLVILRNLGNTCGFTMPWRYDRTRDLRTLESLAGASSVDRVKAQIPHDAGWDAHAQALTAIKYHQKVFAR